MVCSGSRWYTVSISMLARVNTQRTDEFRTNFLQRTPFLSPPAENYLWQFEKFDYTINIIDCVTV